MENVCMTFDKVTKIDDGNQQTTPNYAVDVDMKVVPPSGGATLPEIEFSINEKGSKTKVHYVFSYADFNDFLGLMEALWQNAT